MHISHRVLSTQSFIMHKWTLVGYVIRHALSGLSKYIKLFRKKNKKTDEIEQNIRDCRLTTDHVNTGLKF